MWKIVLTTLQNLLTLARDLEENRKEIKELNEKIYKLASAVRSLSEKIESNAQYEASERKSFTLEVQNELLKAGKRVQLPKTRKARRKSIKAVRKT